MNTTDLQKKKINYSWVIISLSALVVFVSLGFCSSPKSLYVKAITEALGISRSSFSLNESCRYIATAIVNLFFGKLIIRYNSKKLMIAGFLSLITSNLVYSFASNIVMFCIGGTLLGVGLSWTTTTMVGYIVNKWHPENKGTIMGAVLASNGVGGAIAIQVLSPIIAKSVFGYKNAYRFVALLLLAICVLVLIFFKDKKDSENKEENIQKKKTKGRNWVGLDYHVASKKPYFYTSLVCIFLTGTMIQGVTGIATPHMYDAGVNVAFVATVLSCHSLFLTVFKFLNGFLYDRIGLRFTSNLSMFAAIACFILLIFTNDSASGRTFAMFYGIASALALPLETVMLPIYASDLFGEKSFGKILGLFASVNTAGYALGAPISNLCYDITGSYKVFLCISCVIMLGIMIAMNFTISSANKERMAIADNN